MQERQPKWEGGGKRERERFDTVSLYSVSTTKLHVYSHRIFRAAPVHKNEEIGPGMSENLSKATPSRKRQIQDLSQLF